VRITAAPGASPTVGTVVVRDGRIESVGAAPTPAGATRFDGTGLWVYPGLIEPFLPSDVPALDPSTDDRHWNPMVQPQRRARDGALVPADERDTLRRLGFTAAACAPSGGILKGTATVVLLDDPDDQRPVRIVREDAAMVASLQTSRDGYPGSEMGAMALLRQTLLDGQWYERCLAASAKDPSLQAAAPQPSAALAALVLHRTLPLFCDSQDELQALRLLQVAAEFGRRPVVVGSGMEFRRLAAFAQAKVPLIVPLHVPDAPEVATVTAAERVTLRQLQSWEQAPTNSKRLLDAGLEVAWTTARLRDRKDFLARARDAIACGVTSDQALAALTTVPARSCSASTTGSARWPPASWRTCW
jgi:imidazolonepropionase-like amidohydrolase